MSSFDRFLFSIVSFGHCAQHTAHRESQLYLVADFQTLVLVDLWNDTLTSVLGTKGVWRAKIDLIFTISIHEHDTDFSGAPNGLQLHITVTELHSRRQVIVLSRLIDLLLHNFVAEIISFVNKIAKVMVDIMFAVQRAIVLTSWLFWEA